MKSILVLGLLVAALAVAGWLMFNPSTPKQTAQINTERVVAPEPPRTTPTPTSVAPALMTEPSLAEEPVKISKGAPPEPAKNNAPQNIAPQSSPGKKQKPPLQDPTAHVAMSLVGIDPEAEAYWFDAIFDTSLPKQEREDLMEDLNEAGLSDPKHPTPDDRLVISNRLQPIEYALQYADPFMQEHLMEAYKDLVNLLNGFEPD